MEINEICKQAIDYCENEYKYFVEEAKKGFGAYIVNGRHITAKMSNRQSLESVRQKNLYFFLVLFQTKAISLGDYSFYTARVNNLYEQYDNEISLLEG